jgi:hypothetical protein
MNRNKITRLVMLGAHAAIGVAKKATTAITAAITAVAPRSAPISLFRR